jgi:DNA-binding IclR family transcriptional regulator
LSPQTLETLNRALPPFWSHANPIDILGDAGPVFLAISLADPRDRHHDDDSEPLQPRVRQTAQR